MGKKKNKGWIAKHSKSSAMVVSLAIHALLVIIAVSFVAVSVITKEEQKFEAKPVNRPKMQLKKLQVPVNVKKKKTQKPKLRKRIVVQPKLNQSVPDIKMPEISGVKGGLGNAGGAGLGGAGGLGFSMPEIEIFGVKGKGEKIFLVLDTGNKMLEDKMGGIPAYTIIKQELVRIVEELPPTALFNICVFGSGGEETLFPSLVPANDLNASKAREWIDPLNSSANAARSGNYGIKTLGEGGVKQTDDLRMGRFAKPLKPGCDPYKSYTENKKWYTAVMLAHKQQADTIFVLTDDWGHQRAAMNRVTDYKEWIATTSDGKKWAEAVRKGKQKLAEENKRRKAEGKPPKVIAHGDWGLVGEYFPGTTKPPQPEWYFFKPNEFVEVFQEMREKHTPDSLQTRSGLTRKKSRKPDFSLHVIQFVRADGHVNEKTEGKFKKLTDLCSGQYQTIAGLDEIKSFVGE